MVVAIRGQELAEAVIKQVREDPRSHEQDYVTNGFHAHECGVKACLAGWTFLFAYEGKDVEKVLEATSVEDGNWAKLAACFPDDANFVERHELGEGEAHSALAAHILGIPVDRWKDFERSVYSNMNEFLAIENFRELTGL